MESALALTLILLASAVLVVVIFRSLNFPPVLGYLLVGALIGPHALHWVPESTTTAHLAEFGVVFLMFSIGLEFSLPRLFAMKRIVFGLGAAQVIASIFIAMLLARLFGMGWGLGFALGGTLAMSSTAILSRLLADRMELDSKHGQEVMGVLLFQDIAVVPLLILVPALSQPTGVLVTTLALATAKAVAALAAVVFLGQKFMGAWFFIVARRKSAELFILNVLLITLGLAWLTEMAGLSMALGAFLAGMLISETQYRYQVEEDIKPFRDVLLGLFFITIGMFLDLGVVVHQAQWILLVLFLLITSKLLITWGLSKAFGASPGTALRSGLWLCAGGEFGFVLLAQIRSEGMTSNGVLQIILASLVLSLAVAPIIIQMADKIVLRLVASEWLLRSMQLTQIAVQSMGTEKHVILCGYGRTGQHMARILEQENINCVALELDPERVRDAMTTGEKVTYGDSTRRETLIAAGIQRAHVMVITFANKPAALRTLHHARALRADLPIIVRVAQDSDVETFIAAGATEVVQEALESSVMLSTHALALVGVPMSKVIRRLRELREKHYVLLRGAFTNSNEPSEGNENQDASRLLSVSLTEGAFALGKTTETLTLENLGCTVCAVRHHGKRRAPDAQLEMGDVVVLLGPPQALNAGEERLLRGR